MRALALLCIAGLLAAAGCRRTRKARVETVEEEGLQLSPMVHTADPRAGVQLLRGFYGVEQNAWRWTKAQFAVTLKTPADAAARGAILELKLTVPEPVLAHIKSTTLSARVDGSVLEPETYSQAGEHVYRREVPTGALAGDAVTIDFALDRFLAAGQVEERELGVIVTSVGLLPK